MRKNFNSKSLPKGRACADSRRNFWTQPKTAVRVDIILGSAEVNSYRLPSRFSARLEFSLPRPTKFTVFSEPLERVDYLVTWTKPVI